MVDLDKVDWEGIVISAIENPNFSIPFSSGIFEDLRDKATRESRHFEKNKITFENEKYKWIFKIGWDKSKFFFQYEHVVINKKSDEENKRIFGVDEAHGGGRHLHSGKFVIPNPETLIEKIEHPILSLIIKSETESRRSEWIRILANELKSSLENWRRYLGVKWKFNKNLNLI